MSLRCCQYADGAACADAIPVRRQVAAMYSWERVAVRTERIYDAVANGRRDDSMLARLGRFYKCGCRRSQMQQSGPSDAPDDLMQRAHRCTTLGQLQHILGCRGSRYGQDRCDVQPSMTLAHRRCNASCWSRLQCNTRPRRKHCSSRHTLADTVLCVQVRQLVRQDLLLHCGGR